MTIVKSYRHPITEIENSNIRKDINKNGSQPVNSKEDTNQLYSSTKQQIIIYGI